MFKRTSILLVSAACALFPQIAVA
jgi:carboxypeptidase family protein